MQLTVSLPSGKEIEVTIQTKNNDPRITWTCATATMKRSGTCVAKLLKPQQGATHYIDSSPAIGLDATNAQLVTDALAAWWEAWKQTSEGKKQALRKEREDIGYEIAGACDEMEHYRNKAFSHDTGKYWDKANAAKAKAEAAEAKRAAFDLAHPEVLAEILAKKAEATARFLASN